MSTRISILVASLLRNIIGKWKFTFGRDVSFELWTILFETLYDPMLGFRQSSGFLLVRDFSSSSAQFQIREWQHVSATGRNIAVKSNENHQSHNNTNGHTNHCLIRRFGYLSRSHFASLPVEGKMKQSSSDVGRIARIWPLQTLKILLCLSSLSATSMNNWKPASQNYPGN